MTAATPDSFGWSHHVRLRALLMLLVAMGLMAALVAAAEPSHKLQRLPAPSGKVAVMALFGEAVTAPGGLCPGAVGAQYRLAVGAVPTVVGDLKRKALQWTLGRQRYAISRIRWAPTVSAVRLALADFRPEAGGAKPTFRHGGATYALVTADAGHAWTDCMWPGPRPVPLRGVALAVGR